MILIKKAYMKIWKIDRKEKYINATASSGDKQEDGSYKNSNWNLRIIGKAKDKEIKEGDRIEITSAKIENIWDKKNERNWLNVIVFDFENLTSNEEFYPVDDGEDDLPF